MPYKTICLQLFADEGASMAGADTGSASGLATTGAENPGTVGVATETTGEQAAPAQTDQTQPGESWDELIKGKYKKEYNESVKAAVNKRFRNQQNLQMQIDSIDPIVRSLAQRYGVTPNPDGSIPIAALQAKLDADDSVYEREAFDRGISVEELKRFKALERENMQLRQANQRSQEQADWEAMLAQGEELKQLYPQFDMDSEMQNPDFGRLLATLKRSGMTNPLRTAYEAVHRDEIMSGAMQYAVRRTEQKISNSIQSGMNRPAENGTTKAATAGVGSVDPSKLTKAQIDDIKRRAERGEKITF